MLNRPHLRRIVAGLLVVLGGLMIFLTIETWAGIGLLVLGVSLEVIGLALKHGG